MVRKLLMNSNTANEVVLYRNGVHNTNLTGGFTTTAVVYNATEIKMNHNAAGLLETINNVTVTTSNTLCVYVYVVNYTTTTTYQFNIYMNNVLLRSVSPAFIFNNTVNGVCKIEIPITSNTIGKFKIATYFGEYFIKELFVRGS